MLSNGKEPIAGRFERPYNRLASLLLMVCLDKQTIRLAQQLTLKFLVKVVGPVWEESE